MEDKYKSEWATAGNGARMEIATIIHEGREFTSGGSVINHEGGYIVAYVSSDGKELKTWGGELLAPLTITGEIPARWWGNRYLPRITCYSAVVDGIKYHGRGAGPGMFLRLRRSKKQGGK